MARTISGFQGLVQAPDEAGRLHRVSPPRLVGTSAFSVTSGANRVLTVAAGTVLVCGVRFTESATTSITLPAASSTTYDVVGLRFTWSPTGGTVALFTKRGTSTTYPSLDRRPGIVYEMPLFGVRMTSGVSTIPAANFFDVRVNGGIGGPFILSTTAINASSNNAQNLVDLPHGSLIKIGTSTFQVWTVDGAGNITTLLLATSSGPWQPFNPVLRAGGNPVGLGSAPIVVGRYQVRDGTCFVEFSITPGGAGVNMGNGQFSVDLPVMPSGALTDQWGNGYLGTVVGGTMLWAIKGLVRKDFGQRVRLYAPTAGDDARLLPQGSAISPSPGLGIPYIAGNYSIPANLSMNFSYLI